MDKDFLKIGLDALQALGILIGAVWAWYKFRVEKPTHPRIELDLDVTFLGSQEDGYIGSFAIKIANKGTVNHTIRIIELKIHELKKGAPFIILPDMDKRVAFQKMVDIENLIPSKYGYYFVRPNVHQVIHYHTVIPNDTRFIKVWASFKYDGSNDKHTVEKIFEVKG